MLVEFTKLVDTFKQRTEALMKAIAHEGNGDSHKHAKYMRDKIVPAMAALREVGDAIESRGPVQRLAAADISRDAVHQIGAWPDRPSGGGFAIRPWAFGVPGRPWTCLVPGCCEGRRPMTKAAQS